jgi:hypothetical protein
VSKTSETVEEAEGMTTIRVPKSSIRKVKTLASIECKSIEEWTKTNFIELLDRWYSQRIAQESSRHDLGGESGN